MEFRAKRSAESYAKFRGEVIALFTAFTAGVGLKDFISDTIKSEANLGRMSHALDLSVENLSAWQGVLKRNGGTAEDATSAFRSLADIIAELQTTGTTAKGGILARMGIQASDLKDPQAAIVKMAETARTMDPVIASSLLRQIGFSEAMTNAMLQGGQALEAQLEAQRKLGVTTDADVEAAKRLQNTLEGLKTSSARLGAQILTSLEPVLDLLAKGLTALAEWAQRNQPIVLAALAALAAALIAVGVAAGIAAIAASPILGPLIVISGLALAAGAALGVLWEVVTRGAHAFMEFMRSNEATRGAMENVAQAATTLWQAIVAMLAPLRPVFAWITNAFHEIGSAIFDAFGPANMLVARAFISLLVGGLNVVANSLRAVAALLRGDFKGALDAARGIKPAQAARAAPPAAVAPTTAAGVNVVQFMRSRGLSQAQALGVAAGIEAENHGANPNAVNPRSGAFGLGQWLGARKAELFRRYGPNPTASQQLEFLAWELNGGDRGGKAVLQSNTADQALNAYITKFMRPAPGAETTGDLSRGGAFLAANANAPQSSLALGSRAQSAGVAGATNTTTVQIDTLHVNAPNARDAAGIAAGLAPALQRRLGYVGQVAAATG